MLAELPEVNDRILCGTQNIPILTISAVQPEPIRVDYRLHINMICHNLGYGGAERIIQDLVTAYARLRDLLISVNLYVLNEKTPHYVLRSAPHIATYYPQGTLYKHKLQNVACRILASQSSFAYTHLLTAKWLNILWKYGVKTIPVIHNSAAAWPESPSLYNSEYVPFVVAVSTSVKRQLQDARCTVPVQLIRHEIQRWRTAEEAARLRESIRTRHGIADECRLVVMVGRMRHQKAYTRAVEVLSRLRSSQPTRLLIVGGWGNSQEAAEAYNDLVEAATRAKVAGDITLVGDVKDPESYLAAADVFLNTSNYEGYSIAMLEARQLGCPVVSPHIEDMYCPQQAPVMLAPRDPGDPAAYAAEVIRTKDQRTPPLPRPRFPSLVPQLWIWLANYGVDHTPDHAGSVLVLTSNLNPGGAQRSLVNLLTHLRVDEGLFLFVLHPATSRQHVDTLNAASVNVFSVGDSPGRQNRRIDDLFAAIERLRPETVVFWNLDIEVKILLAKIYHHRARRLIEVSPGPKMFRGLESSKDLFHRIGFSINEYFDRLTAIVSKFTDNPDIAAYPNLAEKTYVIPNGVPRRRRAEPHKTQPVVLRPDQADPHLATVTACRLVPQKHLTDILLTAAKLRDLVPGSTLTIVGALDDHERPYWDMLMRQYAELNLQETVFFVGACDNLQESLHEFRVFVMLSDWQGCPNASLEAMEAGLPVVANNDGGTAEQVVDGVTGFLVPAIDPEAVAARIAYLLTHPLEAQQMGLAGRKRTRELFSMEQMVQSYKTLLWPS